ncbi:MAG: VTT domain-containing protein [Hyphomicrobiaceae bacterium]|nr:VTT domain-containing protein [Hyphomicrobiaceae bacterium]
MTAAPAAGEGAAACPMATLPSKRRRLLRLAPLALFLGGIAFATWQGWITALDLETVARLYDRFQGLVAQHPAIALGTYTLVYVLVGALCVPGAALLTAAGGLVFGTVLGALATVVGATIGASVLFLLARNACAGWLESSQGGAWTRKLREGFAQDAFNYLLFLRLAPIFPFWFVNVAAAALGVRARTFVLATLIGIAPATLGFASAGAGLRHVLEAAHGKYEACLAAGGGAACTFAVPPHALLSRDTMLALVLLGLVALVPVIVKKWRRSHV